MAQAANAGTYKVLLADGQAARRRTVRRVLEARGFDVCAEAPDTRGAIHAAVREHPHICVLASNLEGGGIPATREITTRSPETSVVVTGSAQNVDDAFDALYAGASGFLPDEIEPDRLARTLRAVLAGEGALPRRLVGQLIQEFRRQGQRNQLARILRSHGAELTPREWDVIQLLAEGKSTAEISDTLSIAKATVRSHAAAVAKKLGVRDRDAAVRSLKGAFRTLNAQ